MTTSGDNRSEAAATLPPSHSSPITVKLSGGILPQLRFRVLSFLQHYYSFSQRQGSKQNQVSISVPVSSPPINPTTTCDVVINDEEEEVNVCSSSYSSPIIPIPFPPDDPTSKSSLLHNYVRIQSFSIISPRDTDGSSSSSSLSSTPSSSPSSSFSSRSSRSPLIPPQVYKFDPEKGVYEADETHCSNPQFREFELGKITLGFVSPVTAILLALKIWLFSTSIAIVPLISLCFGITFIVIGITHSYAFPIFARGSEELGVMLVFLGFFWSVSSMLSTWYLMVLPWLCFLLILAALGALRFVDFFPHRGDHARKKPTMVLSTTGMRT